MSEEQLKNSIKVTDFSLIKDLFFPSKLRWLLILLIELIYFFFFYFILENNKVFVSFWKEILVHLQTLEITILAFLITGYAIFQAFLDEKTLKKLVETQKKGTVFFVRINKYFYYITLLFFLLIVLNSIILSIVNSFSIAILVKKMPFLKGKQILFICTSIYIFFHTILLLDVKSFLKNIHDVFVINAYYKYRNED